jgi:hypothetical protein
MPKAESTRGRRSKIVRTEPYKKTSAKNSARRKYEFYDLFYGSQGNPTCRWMRSTQNKTGLTRSCYIAQRLFMLRYVLQIYFKYDFTEHSLFENKIFELTNMVQRSTLTQMFQDQNNEHLLPYLKTKLGDASPCIKRLELLTKLSGGNFPEENVEKIKDESLEDIEQLFIESDTYPIPLAFGSNEPRRGSEMYEVDHWFVLYKRKLCGAAGLFPVEISYFESPPIAPADFHRFLTSMINEDPSAFDFFKTFMKETMVPESHALQTYEEEPKPGASDETRGTHKKIPIQPAIEGLLNSYRGKLEDYNIFRLNGYASNPSNPYASAESYATTLFEAIKCILPLDFIDVTNKPAELKNQYGGTNKKRRTNKRRTNKKRRTYKKKKTTYKRKKTYKRK